MNIRSIRIILIFFILSPTIMNAQQHIQSSDSLPPAWAKQAIWYQIFVERFNNGDPRNDPTPENIRTASDFRPVPEDWSVTPWTHNWYKQESWAKNNKMDFYGGLQLRRFGGDLQGIFDKLDIYMNLELLPYISTQSMMLLHCINMMPGITGMLMLILGPTPLEIIKLLLPKFLTTHQPGNGHQQISYSYD